MNHYIREVDDEIKRNKPGTVVRLIWQTIKKMAVEIEQMQMAIETEHREVKRYE